MVAYICHPSTEGWGERQEDPWNLLTSQSSQIDELHLQGETLSQNIKWRATEADTTQSQHIHKCMHTHPCAPPTHMHTYEHTERNNTTKKEELEYILYKENKMVYLNST